MSSSYDARGRRTGVTLVEILPNLITQVKTTDGKDGYNAFQLGTGTKKSVKKPQLGQIKKLGFEQKVRWLREVRSEEKLKAGEKINLSGVFSVGDSVKISGVSKGKGFQGGVRRHGFAGGPKTHGQSDRHRAPGSIGQTTTPGRVYKGKRMAGHMGARNFSVRNLEVVKVDKKDNLLIVKGAVPGAIGSLLRIEKLGRIRGYTPPPEEKIEEENKEEKETESKEEKPAEKIKKEGEENG